MNFRAFVRAAAEQNAVTDPTDSDPTVSVGQPRTTPDNASTSDDAEGTAGQGAGQSGTPCSYCGGTYFEPPEDNGKVQRAECEECGGTMVSHDGGYWQPDLIGQPDNHPSEHGDARSGGVGGIGNVDQPQPVSKREEDLSSRTAGVDWCRHRRNEHCWLPRNDTRGQFALYQPQDRGVCPWTIASQQQINCPVSEPGPMSAMARAAAYGDPVGALMPVKHAGFHGHVEHYDGADEEQRDMDREDMGQSPGHQSFDEDLWDHTAPDLHSHEQRHLDEHDDYPDEYHERHEEAYAQAHEQRQRDLAPVGHHTNLINFVRSHGDDHKLWNKNGQMEDIDHSQHKVIATQPYVVKHHLDRYMANRDDDVAHVHEHGMGEWNENYHGTHYPMMVRHEGNLFCTEGHHRTASDIMSGRKTHAIVYDADKHGFPQSGTLDYEADHPGMHRYAKKSDCDFRISDPKKRRDHEVRHHDDGVCTLTEAKRHREKRRKTSALADPEMRFHVLARWADVRDKAKRIRATGGVVILSSFGDQITGNVQGDNGVYESQLNYVPGSRKVGFWQCGCAWASYSWGRSKPFRKFEGRMCSHALALQYEAQSRGMFGREVVEDTQRPGWMRDKVRVRHDRTTRDHDVREASGGTTERALSWHVGSDRQVALDPEGVYPTDHGLELGRRPLDAFAAVALAERGDPADVVRVGLALGLSHAAARDLLQGLEQLAASLEITAKGDEPDVEEPPTHAGVALRAADTGRVLMIQRSHHDESDPAAGTWEFPGGGREPGDHNSLMSGVREWEEETGQKFPTEGTVTHVWRSGPYQGHVVVIPHEHQVDFSGGRRTVNPDDPDGDDHEQSAWWDPEHARKNPALRPECKGSPWDKIKTATLHTAIDPGRPDQFKSCTNCGHKTYKGAAACPNCGEHLDSERMRLDAESARRTADYAAHDNLGDFMPDWRPKPPARPLDGSEENPASTGWATAGDPPEWDNAAARSETMSLQFNSYHPVEIIWPDAGGWPVQAELNDHPEPALPATTGEDETEGERYRAQMQPEVDPTEDMMPSDGRTASMSTTVARFQASAAGQALASNSAPRAREEDKMDIAQAAREHLAGSGGIQRTALRDFSATERHELITEGLGTQARNFNDLRIEGTHYEAIEAALSRETSLDPDDLFE